MDYNKLILPLMMILRKAKPDESVINSLIKSRVWYTVDISTIYHSITPVFSAISDKGSKSMYIDESGEVYTQFRTPFGASSVDLIWYKKVPLLILKRHFKDTHASNYEIMTLNNKYCREMVIEFVKKCVAAQNKFAVNTFAGQIDIVDYTGRNGEYLHCDKKSFDDVFLPDEQQNAIINGVNDFINKIPWMEENHIPTHYGILLYGTPGCGRTSIIKAIINKWNIRPHYIQQLECLPQLVMSQLPTRKTPTNELHMVICEDIDCTLFNRQKGFKETKYDEEYDEFECNGAFFNPNLRRGKTSLSQVLNAIDGMVAPHNTLFVFTTNHIEELDPALIRPGRMDLHLEIKPICKETLNKFCLKFFGKSIPEDFKCKEGVLFSTLQTIIMGNGTYDDILNYMKEE